MDDHQERMREVGARTIWSARGEDPEYQDDARGNALRWQDCEHLAEAVLVELQAAELGEPGRSAISHLATVIAKSCEDDPDLAWKYERVAGDALRAYAVR
ncbi:hypothetical protein [Burkholderia pseudomultivorans]|uniref:hypothetical protein n=1 Tax=Burkholderia pseudomultivorans TaxID=1207504 RepID=UPI0009BFD510|nr:hypothetical protein [Burkholderia pseudomultivorans]